MKRARWIAPFLPIFAAVAWILVYRSWGPEPADWLAFWNDPDVLYDPQIFFIYPDRDNFFVTRAVQLFAWTYGPDYPLLAFTSWLLTSIAFVTLWSFRPRSAVWLTVAAALMFSPGFGANWIVFERFRFVLPMTLAALSVFALTRIRSFRSAYGAALALSTLAVFTSECGAVLWLGLLPVVVHASRRAGSRVFVALALWLVVGNVAALFCFDYQEASFSGLLVSLWTNPSDSLSALARVATAGVPDIVRGLRVDSWALAGIMGVALVGIVAAYVRADDEVRRRAIPWLGVATCGLAQIVGTTNARFPSSLTGSVLEEACPGSVLLPVGLAASAAVVLPGLAARCRGPVLGIALVLIAQDYYHGLAGLRVEAQLLRQSEAALVLADIGDSPLPTSPRPSVLAKGDREQLRYRGKLARLAPLPDLSLGSLRIVEGENVGDLRILTSRAASGVVARADLVLLTRARDGAPPRIFAIGLPGLPTNGESAWAARMSEVEPFTAGETVRAYAFDVRERVVRALNGNYAFSDGAFRLLEAKDR